MTLSSLRGKAGSHGPSAASPRSGLQTGKPSSSQGLWLAESGRQVNLRRLCKNLADRTMRSLTTLMAGGERPSVTAPVSCYDSCDNGVTSLGSPERIYWTPPLRPGSRLGLLGERRQRSTSNPATL